MTERPPPPTAPAPPVVTTEVGSGYPAFQLARALAAAERAADPGAARRAARRVRDWTAVLMGQWSGRITPGSRTPVLALPAWVTLQVMHGGFASGEAVAGGPLQPHETEWLVELGLAPAGALPDVSRARSALNAWFVSDAGLDRLRRGLEDGSWRIDVPEEAALATVVGLVDAGHADAALDLVRTLRPFFDRLRFYPRPVIRPTTVPGGREAPAATRGYATDDSHDGRVSIATVDAVVEQLRTRPENRNIAAQREAVTVWTPLYDDLVALLLETVDGEPPRARRDADGRGWALDAGRTIIVDGGWPFAITPPGWETRAAALLARYRTLSAEHRLCTRPHRPDSSLGLLLDALDRRLRAPTGIGRDIASRARQVLGRYRTRRGDPQSEGCLAERQREFVHAAAPDHRRLAQRVAQRLNNEGPGLGAAGAPETTEALQSLVRPISAEEAQVGAVPEGTPIPPSLVRIVRRCLRATVGDLADQGVIPSADSLASLIPRLTATLHVADLPAPGIRALYAAHYEAFRRRRSLLLTDLQHQVRIGELPWVAATDRWLRTHDRSGEVLARDVLADLVMVVLGNFPHAPLTNPLIREFSALARSAGLDLLLTEEIAADIFIGRFSPKFARAAREAWPLIDGTLYARYYRIDAPAPAPDDDSAAAMFSERCRIRAGVDDVRTTVRGRGAIIEQQQVLTTHGLAALVQAVDLRPRLAPRAGELARRAFDWSVRRMNRAWHEDHWRGRRVLRRQSANAWRQMVFLLSLCPKETLVAWLHEAESSLARQPAPFRDDFAPTLAALAANVDGFRFETLAVDPDDAAPGPYYGNMD